MKRIKQWPTLSRHTAAAGIAVLLAACSGSDSYCGEWKGMDGHNRPQQLIFAEKTLTVRDSAGGREKTYTYSQHAVHYENGKKRYGIRLGGGEEWQIWFPFPNDDSRALLQAPDQTPLFTLSREDHIPLQKFWSLPQ